MRYSQHAQHVMWSLLEAHYMSYDMYQNKYYVPATTDPLHDLCQELDGKGMFEQRSKCIEKPPFTMQVFEAARGCNIPLPEVNKKNGYM